jgi:hypothetical protein
MQLLDPVMQQRAQISYRIITVKIIVLSITALDTVMLNVIMLSVVAPFGTVLRPQFFRGVKPSTTWRGFYRDKRTSLLQSIVNYQGEKVYSTGTVFKTLYIVRNL